MKISSEMTSSDCLVVSPSKHDIRPNVVVMLAHRQRRWPSIKTTLSVFPGLGDVPPPMPPPPNLYG